jgi:hypothetical protein
MAGWKRRRRRRTTRSRSGPLGAALFLIFLAGIVLFVLGYAHLHDGAIKHASDIMIVGICLIVLAPITYVVRSNRRTT